MPLGANSSDTLRPCTILYYSGCMKLCSTDECYCIDKNLVRISVFTNFWHWSWLSEPGSIPLTDKRCPYTLDEEMPTVYLTRFSFYLPAQADDCLIETVAIRAHRHLYAIIQAPSVTSPRRWMMLHYTIINTYIKIVVILSLSLFSLSDTIVSCPKASTPSWYLSSQYHLIKPECQKPSPSTLTPSHFSKAS